MKNRISPNQFRQETLVFTDPERKRKKPVKTRPITNVISEGQVFGCLTVVRREDKFDTGGMRRRSYLCDCSCGKRKVVDAQHLVAGTTKSCGCSHTWVNKNLLQRKTHGQSYTREYRLVEGIIARCTNPRHRAFHSYGARGITVWPEWKEDRGAFVAYINETIGPRPTSQHSIDRIDNNKGYEPGNIRWATPKDQAAVLQKIHSK